MLSNQEFEFELEKLERVGASLSPDISDYSPAISTQLKTVRDKIQELKTLISATKEKLGVATEYFKLFEKSEIFLKESNRGLLEWSSRMSNISNSHEAGLMATEVETVCYFYML